MMDEEIRQALSEVREMKKMCGNINMKLTNIVTQRGQDIKKKLEAEYKRGLEDGKAQSELGCEGCKHEGISRALSPCHYCTRNSTDYWTAKQADDEIKVGDEVEWEGVNFTVLRVFTPKGCYGQCDGFDCDGNGYTNILTKDVTKTGRHFDIASILEDMRE